MKNPVVTIFLSLALLAPTTIYANNIFSSNDEVEIYDPFEKYNRKIYKFNLFVDKYTTKPIAKAYRKATTPLIRRGVDNFLFNIRRPISSLNSGLQQDYHNLLSNLGAFVVDSTIGIAGIFKVSEKIGIRDRYEDFGQTLAVYDVPAGPYLMVPFMGPSNIRDFSGRAIDIALDMPFWNEISDDDANMLKATSMTLRVISTREKILETWDDIEQNSIDPYGATRSIYYQYRDNQIANE